MAALIGFALVILTQTTSGQSNASTSIQPDSQSWDELDVSAKLTNTLDLSCVSQAGFSAGFPNPATYLSGVDLSLNSRR
jgi:hypothetical protein